MSRSRGQQASRRVSNLVYPGFFAYLDQPIDIPNLLAEHTEEELDDLAEVDFGLAEPDWAIDDEVVPLDG